jgi:UDP-glucose 4-epimerase
MIKKILVTGSLGQVGSYLCEELLANNLEIIGLDNEVTRCHNLPDKLEQITIKGDICDEALVNKIMKKVDAVVHCAAQTSVEKSLKNPKYDLKNNVIGTNTLLDAAARNKSIKCFVYISSAAIYGNPIKLPIDEKHQQGPLSPYGVSKLTAEKYVDMYRRIFKIPSVIIRPFNIYSVRADPKSPYSGVITKFIDRVKSNKPPVIEGDGTQTRDFIHAKDVVRMIRMILKNRNAIGEIFNSGCGKPISINELASAIIKNSGKNLNTTYKTERKGDIKHSYSNMQKAKKILNFVPTIKLKDGLEEIIN